MKWPANNKQHLATRNAYQQWQHGAGGGMAA